MEWQPIETAPKDGTAVILFAPDNWGGSVEQGEFYKNGEWWIQGAQITLNNPTHWMPLPKPPLDGTDKER